MKGFMRLINPFEGFIILRLFFTVYRAKNGKKRQNCIVQRDGKKTCTEDIYTCLSHHRVYKIAWFIDFIDSRR